MTRMTDSSLDHILSVLSLDTVERDETHSVLRGESLYFQLVAFMEVKLLLSL